MKILFKVPSKNLRIDMEVEPHTYVVDLKILLEAQTGIPSGQMQLSTEGGRAMADDDTLLTYFSAESAVLVVALPGAGPAAGAPGRAMPRASEIQRASQNLMEDVMGQSKEMNDVLESNPDVGQFFSDPSILKENLELLSNPSLMNEMMRNKDRAIQNVENIPEGFNTLNRIYSSIEEPLQNALSNSLLHRKFVNTEGEPTLRRAEPSFEMPDGAAMANPWGPRRPLFGGLNAPKRSSSLKSSRTAPAAPKPPAAEQPSNENPSELYRPQLQQLQMMGFNDTQRNINALQRTGGNVEAAVNLLLS